MRRRGMETVATGDRSPGSWRLRRRSVCDAVNVSPVGPARRPLCATPRLVVEGGVALRLRALSRARKPPGNDSNFNEVSNTSRAHRPSRPGTPWASGACTAERMLVQ